MCQSYDIFPSPSLLQLTPGVSMSKSEDSLGQRYKDPRNVVFANGADIGVVGRGIYQSSNPAEAAKQHKDALWSAYLERVADME